MRRTLLNRMRVATAIWRRYLTVKVLLVRRLPLPAVVEALRSRPRTFATHQEPRQLGRSVARALTVGKYQPRCLTMALVHYSLLRDLEVAGDLVIGLPAQPTNPRAHAWVEIEGVDIGPPPGRHGHEEMARFR